MSIRNLNKRIEAFNNVFESVPESYLRSLQLQEFLIMLNPHEELRERITKLKADFSKKFQTKSVSYNRPHLALVHFKSWRSSEEKIVNRLRQIAMGTAPFKVELKDYGCYPTHSIFINVTTKVPIVNLSNEIKTVQKHLRADPSFEPHFITDPNFTIANKLLPWQFENAWKDYAHRHFTGHFIASHFLLLKKSENAKGFQIVERMEFQNLPVNTTQPSLFA